MSWTKDNQASLDRLRSDELAGLLTEPERLELAALMAQVEAEEAHALAPAMSRLRAEVGERAQNDERTRVRESGARLRGENSALQDEVARLRTAMVELLRRKS